MPNASGIPVTIFPGSGAPPVSLRSTSGKKTITPMYRIGYKQPVSPSKSQPVLPNLNGSPGSSRRFNKKRSPADEESTKQQVTTKSSSRKKEDLDKKDLRRLRSKSLSFSTSPVPLEKVTI